MPAVSSLPLLLWRTLRMPTPPKMSKLQKLALIIGFVVWFGLGFLLKYQYDKYIAIGIGFIMSYGPLICWISILHLAYAMFDRRRIEILLLMMMFSGPLAYVVGALESSFIKGLLLNAGLTLEQQAPLSVSICIITWLLMPYLWQKGKTPPAAAA